jgi:hypothetical protein
MAAVFTATRTGAFLQLHPPALQPQSTASSLPAADRLRPVSDPLPLLRHPSCPTPWITVTLFMTDPSCCAALPSDRAGDENV